MKGTLGGGQNSSHGAQVCGQERGSSDWFSPPGVQAGRCEAEAVAGQKG